MRKARNNCHVNEAYQAFFPHVPLVKGTCRITFCPFCLTFFSPLLHLLHATFDSQDISVPEAVSLTDFDESALRANQAAANSLFASSAEGSVAKATATIQQNVNSAIARALNITL